MHLLAGLHVQWKLLDVMRWMILATALATFFFLHHEATATSSTAASSTGLLDVNKEAVKTQFASLPHVTIQFYEVHGYNAEDLRDAMDTLGPLDLHGKRRDAYTHWEIEWSWRRTAAGYKVNTDTAYSVTLPHWQVPETASPQLRRDWKEFLYAIIRHERAHVAMAHLQLSAVKPIIEQAIQRGVSARDVRDKELSKRANAAAFAVTDRMHALDRLFDAVTNSGKLQGVVFPPRE